MAGAKIGYRPIVCLESLWDDDLNARLTMEPVLRTVSTFNRVSFIHFTCNTAPELEHNLKLLRRRTKPGVLYLALHGYPGHVELDGAAISLPSLAGLLGKHFRRWVLHLGTCETIAVPAGDLDAFLRWTGIAMVLGYRKSVDWIDAAATDFLLLDWLENRQALGPMWGGFRGAYPDLIRKTGLLAHVRR